MTLVNMFVLLLVEEKENKNNRSKLLHYIVNIKKSFSDFLLLILFPAFSPRGTFILYNM